MGWQEGQGLGKSNQGRTTIIEVVLTTFEFETLLTKIHFAFRPTAGVLKQDWA